MKLRRQIVVGLTLCAVAGAVVPAQADVIELGRPTGAPPPSCPSEPCLAISRTTGYQVTTAGERGKYTIPDDGRIVAITFSVGKPTDEQVKFFNKKLGGKPQVRLTVLRQSKRLFSTVVGQSDMFDLTPYLGKTAQIPFEHTLAVKAGDVLAITVPTWAPLLAVGLDKTSGWRASRGMSACEDTLTQTAQQRLRQNTQYRCYYNTAQLTFSATLITTPK